MCSFYRRYKCAVEKNIFSVLLIALFLSSCQSIEPISNANYSHSESYLTKSSENGSSIPFIIAGKDIKYSKTISVNDEGWPKVSYSFDSYETGLFYLSIIAMPADDAVYSVLVNGESAGTMSSEGYGWQIMGLDGDGSITKPIHIRRGANKIEFVSSAYEVPQIRDIALVQHEGDCNLSLDNYHRYLQNIETAIYDNDDERRVASPNFTGYQYELACPVLYSTTVDMIILNNQSFRIQVSGFNTTISVDIFDDTSLVRSYDVNQYSNEVTDRIPNGHYTVHIRRSGQRPCRVGMLSLFYNASVVNYSNSVAAGYNMSTGNQTLPLVEDDNYFTCNETFGSDPALYLTHGVDDSYYENDDYVGPGNYDWGLNARAILPYNSDVETIHLYSSDPNSIEGTCDVYQRMRILPDSRWSDFQGLFPVLNRYDAIVTGDNTDTYNCISWSGDIDYSYEWPPCMNSSYYIEGDPLGSFDRFYESRGYTRNGADENNAAIALWAKDDVFTHASVRNNDLSYYPHGYDWESKIGPMERIMHPRDALESNNYGIIEYYYKPLNPLNPLSSINDTLEPLVALDYDSSIISDYIRDNIEEEIVGRYDALYESWVERCQEPDVLIHSNPVFYKNSVEYELLFGFCSRMRRQVLPLVYEKVCEGDVLSMFLMEDLMDDEGKAFLANIRKKNFDTKRFCAPIYNAMCYAAGTFERDYIKK